MNIFSGNSLWQLIQQSDGVTKLVLLILFIMSIVCWTIFIGKFALLRIKQRQFKNMNKKIQNTKTLNDLIEITTHTRNNTANYFIAKNITFLKELTSTTFNQKINEYQWELIERNSDNLIETILLHNEEYISLLSSSATVSPLLGLFGTVWGLIHAFMRISESQVADIATVAPGIAEALITTLAGLIVAIPAMLMFNYLQTTTRILEHNLIILADRMTFIFQHLRERH